ncbi:MAG TPA: DUF2188 domain-containing protein [Phenylobacterium sp.]|nr:DUF2188 domain-containing protein [Phenylobacterium sp.]
MSHVVYQLVEHDGGWAYRSDGVYSETFPTRQAARHAAQRAAREQRVPGQTEEIQYEDANGVWRIEHADGADRPETDVIG